MPPSVRGSTHINGRKPWRKYMFQARYTSEGAKGVIAAGGTARREAVAKAVASVGGKLESFYFAFGGVDAFVVADLPDDVTAAAMAMAVGAVGHIEHDDGEAADPRGHGQGGEDVDRLQPPGK